MDLLIRLVIWLVQTIYQEISSANTQRELRAGGIDPNAVEVTKGESAAQVRSRLDARLAQLLSSVTAALARGDAALGSVDALERDLGAIQGGRVLRDLLRDQVRPSLDAHVGALRAARDNAAVVPAHVAIAQIEADVELRDAVNAVVQASVQVSVLAALRDSRSDPEEAYRLADADAIATSLLQPIQEFAFAQQIGLPAERPIAAPASPGGEAIWFALLPDAHPIIFVPADFHVDLYRYASVPHELGHLLWRDVPGLSDELRRVAEFPHVPGMITVREGQLSGSLDQFYTAWFSEIWSDMAAVLLLGPAGLRGLIHSFAAPDDPERVVTVRAGRGGYDEHPPAHVRVHLAAHVLWTMGFDQEANLLRTEWDAQHNTPDKVFVPLSEGRWFQLSLDPLLELGREIVGRVYMAQLESMRGFRMADIPGMEMGPGLWARVLRRAELLAAGTAFNDDGRIVLAAAIHARAVYPARAALIARGLRAAVLGRDTDERRAADAHYRGSAGAGPATGLAADMYGAFVLREVLNRRPYGSRRSR